MDRHPTEGGKQYNEKEIQAYFESSGGEGIKKKSNSLYGRREVTADDFKIMHVLGKGAFGTVLLVEEKDTNIWFAMKVLKKSQIL